MGYYFLERTPVEVAEGFRLSLGHGEELKPHEEDEAGQPDLEAGGRVLGQLTSLSLPCPQHVDQ